MLSQSKKQEECVIEFSNLPKDVRDLIFQSHRNIAITCIEGITSYAKCAIGVILEQIFQREYEQKQRTIEMQERCNCVCSDRECDIHTWFNFHEDEDAHIFNYGLVIKETNDQYPRYTDEYEYYNTYSESILYDYKDPFPCTMFYQCHCYCNNRCHDECTGDWDLYDYTKCPERKRVFQIFEEARWYIQELRATMRFLLKDNHEYKKVGNYMMRIIDT